MTNALRVSIANTKNRMLLTFTGNVLKRLKILACLICWIIWPAMKTNSSVSFMTEFLTVEQLKNRGGAFQTEHSSDGYMVVRFDLSRLKECKATSVIMVISDESDVRIAGFHLGKMSNSNEYSVNIKREFFTNSNLSITCEYEGFLSYINVAFKGSVK